MWRTTGFTTAEAEGMVNRKEVTQDCYAGYVVRSAGQKETCVPVF